MGAPEPAESKETANNVGMNQGSAGVRRGVGGGGGCKVYGVRCKV